MATMATITTPSELRTTTSEIENREKVELEYAKIIQKWRDQARIQFGITEEKDLEENEKGLVFIFKNGGEEYTQGKFTINWTEAQEIIQSWLAPGCSADNFDVIVLSVFEIDRLHCMLHDAIDISDPEGWKEHLNDVKNRYAKTPEQKEMVDCALEDPRISRGGCAHCGYQDNSDGEDEEGEDDLWPQLIILPPQYANYVGVQYLAHFHEREENENKL